MLSIFTMFENYRLRRKIKPGMKVKIVLKKDQGTNKRVIGIVQDLLTKKNRHTRGIKVRLKDGKIGRVQEILS